jgi:hypothetical protein
MAKKNLPSDVLEFFRREGSRGGKKAAAALSPEQRRARATKASLALSPELRSERARNAVTAREVKRKAAEKSPNVRQKVTKKPNTT